MQDMQETWGSDPWSQEDPLEEVATHSSYFAWEISGEGAWRAKVHVPQELDKTETTEHTYMHTISKH